MVAKKSQVKIIDSIQVNFVLQEKVAEIECWCTLLICAELHNHNIKLCFSSYPQLKRYLLADTFSDKNREINLKIGVNYHYRFVCGSVIQRKENEQIVAEFLFG